MLRWLRMYRSSETDPHRSQPAQGERERERVSIEVEMDSKERTARLEKRETYLQIERISSGFKELELL